MSTSSATRWFLTAFLGLALVAGACGPAPGGSAPGGAGNQAQGEIKIGAIFDATGGASSLGSGQRDTAALIEKQVNAKGGIDGRPIKIVFYDSQSDETQAVTAAQKAIQTDNVVAIVGGTTSGATLAMVNVVETNKVPLLSVAAAQRIVEPVKPYVFKTPQSDSLAIRRLFPYFKANNIKRIGFLSSNNAYGDSGRSELQKLASEGGYQIVADERFNLQDTSMVPQLTRIRAANPDAVINWSIPPTASTVTREYRQLGLKPPLIQSHGVANQAFLEQSGPAANGVVMPIGRLPVVDELPEDNPQKQVLRQYRDDFQKEYGRPPNTFGGHAWDGFQMVIKAVDEVGADREKVRTYIENQMGEFVGITGVFRITPQDHMGLGVDAFELAEIRDGKWSILGDYPVQAAR